MSDTAWLHIYAHAHEHADAHIIGNRRALGIVRDAIVLALQRKDGRATPTGLFASNGEGYDLRINAVEDSPMAMMRMPYYSESEVHRLEPHRCPVCLGTQEVSVGQGMGTTMLMTPCKPCSGTGVLWK